MHVMPPAEGPQMLWHWQPLVRAAQLYTRSKGQRGLAELLLTSPTVRHAARSALSCIWLLQA